MYQLPSSKSTVRPWQSSGLEDEFPLEIGDFQCPTVNLPESISHMFRGSIRICT